MQDQSKLQRHYFGERKWSLQRALGLAVPFVWPFLLSLLKHKYSMECIDRKSDWNLIDLQGKKKKGFIEWKIHKSPHR